MADIPLFASFRRSRLFGNAPLLSEASWALQYSEFVGSKDFFLTQYPSTFSFWEYCGRGSLVSMPLKKKTSSSPPSPLPPIASFPYQTKKRLGTGVEGEERERGPFTSRAAFQTVRYTYVVGHLKRHTFSPGSFLRTCRKKTCLLLLGVCPPPFEDGRRNERDLGIRLSKSRVLALGSAITEKEARRSHRAMKDGG